MVRRRQTVRESFPAAPLRAAPLRPIFETLSYLQVVEPYTFPRHQHLNFEIIIIDHGSYRCTLNGVPLRLQRNQILVVKPGDWHHDVLTPPVGYYGLIVRMAGDALRPPTLPLVPDADPHQQVVEVRREAFWPLLRRLKEESQLADAFAPRLQETAASEFFWRLIRALPPEVIDQRVRHESQEERFVSQLQQLFAAHQHGPLGIPRMAAVLGMSRSSLSAKCRTYFAMSPAQLFRKHRMERALELLTGTGMSVSEVAEFLGFENPFHFSRVFRRHYGRPPSQA